MPPALVIELRAVSVAVALNLSDGVILGVDSAVTVPGPGGVVKVYENAQKLYQVGDKPMGVAFFGLGSLGTRSLGSVLREFEVKNPLGVLSAPTTVPAVVEGLRAFFTASYQQLIIPAVEAAQGKPFEQFSPQERQAITLGVVVGGFSDGAYLSEVWQIHIPGDTGRDGVASNVRPQGNFGSNWFAMFDPIRRYIKGVSPDLLNEVLAWLLNRRSLPPLDPTERAELDALLAKYEYQIPFPAMPMQEGVHHVRFLVDLVIGHHRFAVGAPVVGGKARVGKVTYLGGKFEILDDQ